MLIKHIYLNGINIVRSNKTIKNKFVKLKEILDYFSDIELRENILQNILKNEIDGIKFKTLKIINLREKIRVI